LQYLNDGGYRGSFLTNGYINAIYRITSLVVGTLIDDGINGDGRLTCLTVADNQLALATANGYHGIDGFQTGLKGFLDGLTENHPGSLAFKRHFGGGVLDGAFAIEGIPQCVDDPAQQAFSSHEGSDFTGTFHGIVFLYQGRVTEQNGSNIVFFEVHCNAPGTVVEFQQLSRADISQPVNADHTVTHLQHDTGFIQLDHVAYALQFVAQEFADFTHFYLLHSYMLALGKRPFGGDRFRYIVNCFCIVNSCVRTLASNRFSSVMRM